MTQLAYTARNERIARLRLVEQRSYPEILEIVEREYPDATVSYHRARGIASEWAGKIAGVIAPILPPSQPIIQFPTIKAYPLPEPDPEPPLTDDFEEFNDNLNRLKRDVGMIRVVVRSDAHIPDHDRQAQQVGTEIVRAVKPHITMDAGDVLDLSGMSRFPAGRHEGKRDEFITARPYYQQRVEAVQEAHPGTLQCSMSGNHNERANDFSNLNFAAGDTLERDYAALIRAGGLVKWLGWRQEVDLGCYRVLHGERYSKRAHEDTLLKDYDGVQVLSQGHTHRVGMYVSRQIVPGESRYRIVSAVNAGFEGKNPPQYYGEKKSHTKWIHSCIVAYVNLRGDDVHLFPIVYHKRADGVMVAVVPGAAVIEVAPQA